MRLFKATGVSFTCPTGTGALVFGMSGLWPNSPHSAMIYQLMVAVPRKERAAPNRKLAGLQKRAATHSENRGRRASSFIARASLALRVR